MRVGDVSGAVEQLSLATAMRPARQEYQRALREARATLRARDLGGWPPRDGEPGPAE
jgi:hypothetical protein